MAKPLVALAWAQNIDGVTLAVASGFDLEARLREVVGSPVEESLEDFKGAFEKGWLGDGNPNSVAIQFDGAPGGDLVIEPNGYLMSAYAAEMTRGGGSLVSVYWQDAIGREQVTFARDGRTVRAFESYDLERGEGVKQPEEEDLPWRAAPRAAMVALIERVAMFPVTEEWLLRTPRRTWMLVEPRRV